MLPFGVTIPATVLQRLEIPEVLMNYPVLTIVTYTLDMSVNLLFNVNVTPHEAHLIYSLNDAYFEGLQSSSSVVNTCAVATFGFVSFHVQRLT
jgi:hypothetical protein